MYAIVFDLDQDTLEKTYHGPCHTDAYSDIRKTLEGRGFTRQQGSVYFGDGDQVNAVACVLAVMELTRQHPWFARSVTDIRMLRIEDSNDLMPVVKKVIGQ